MHSASRGPESNHRGSGLVGFPNYWRQGAGCVFTGTHVEGSATRPIQRRAMAAMAVAGLCGSGERGECWSFKGRCTGFGTRQCVVEGPASQDPDTEIITNAVRAGSNTLGLKSALAREQLRDGASALVITSWIRRFEWSFCEVHRPEAVPRMVGPSLTLVPSDAGSHLPPITHAAPSGCLLDSSLSPMNRHSTAIRWALRHKITISGWRTRGPAHLPTGQQARRMAS